MCPGSNLFYIIFWFNNQFLIILCVCIKISDAHIFLPDTSLDWLWHDLAEYDHHDVVCN